MLEEEESANDDGIRLREDGMRDDYVFGWSLFCVSRFQCCCVKVGKGNEGDDYRKE
jgi:hypothetical protein